MQNRNNRPGSVAKFKTAAGNPTTAASAPSRDNIERQENKCLICAISLIHRTVWARKTTTAAAPLVNRAATPTTSHSRTNSPTPAGNVWTTKVDERLAKESHDQFTHLLFALTVPSSWIL